MAKCCSYASRTLEITVLLDEDLRLDRRSFKKNAYVVVLSESENFRATEMDNGEGGSCPNWNEKLVLDMPLHSQAVTLEVNCKTAFGDRIVGSGVRHCRPDEGAGDGVHVFGDGVGAGEDDGGSAGGKSKCGDVVTGVPVWFAYQGNI
ncbi:hypothetical protein TIFTF001_030429 [Ficus carica]|uniref:C2 domain-containing protein n=1 Tax=Ficus carica TaxID=3494 RepID=A0AA88DTP7_FICCA|nr:hypothetical protein TIFTF001_030429 [Ficus carica]